MSDEDLKERIRTLEARDERIVDMINETEKTIDRLAILVEHLNDLAPRVRDLEQDMINQKVITKAIQWLGLTIGGTAVMMVMVYLFGGAAGIGP
jgi:uncharacterized coiled-coil protein SlyX